MGKVKLYVLKLMFIFVFSAVILTAKLTGNKKFVNLAWPMKWLRHYLLGKGTDLIVPDFIVKGAKSALLTAINRSNADLNDYCYWDAPILDVHEDGSIDLKRRYCVYHSTLYEGAGFFGRPVLFYLMGGFTFRLLEMEGGEMEILGVDHYDWHPTPEGEYFTSPIGDGWLAKTAIKILGAIFGSQYFVNAGFPSNEAGISNKLWADMKLVGAQEFNSRFKTRIELDPEEILDLVSYFWFGYEYSNLDDDSAERAEEEVLSAGLRAAKKRALLENRGKFRPLAALKDAEKRLF